jgi:hypothetical protein
VVETFVTLFVLSILCEAVVEWLKGIVPALAGVAVQIAALVVGLVLAFGAGQNLFALIGVEFAYPIVGTVLAGIVVSRGSNYIHDLIAKLQGEEE